MTDSRSRIKQVLKINRKTFFNPSAWFDWEAMRDLNVTIMDTIRTGFAIPKPDPNAPTETFAQSMKRQKLTEADIKSAYQTYKNFALGFLVLGTLDLLYTLYLLFFQFSILGFLLGAATTALFFGQAFRFDFWAFQIHKRKLGVTVEEWKQHILGKKGQS